MAKITNKPKAELLQRLHPTSAGLSRPFSPTEPHLPWVMLGGVGALTADSRARRAPVAAHLSAGTACIVWVGPKSSQAESAGIIYRQRLSLGRTWGLGFCYAERGKKRKREKIHTDSESYFSLRELEKIGEWLRFSPLIYLKAVCKLRASSSCPRGGNLEQEGEMYHRK